MPEDTANADKSEAEAPAGRQGSATEALAWVVARLGLGALGLAALILGAIVAWNSQSSTALLIIGAILLLFALLGADWEEIFATYGGTSFRLRRRLREIGEQVDEARAIAVVAATEDTPSPELEAVVARLDDLSEQMKAITPPQRPRSRAGGFAGGSSLGRDRAFEALLDAVRKPTTSHSFTDRNAVELILRAPEVREGVQCTVKTPGGTAYSAMARLSGSLFFPAHVVYRVTYPEDFGGSEPLGSGSYEIEWRQALPGNLNLAAAAAALAQGVIPVIATDAFTIPASTGSPRVTGP